MDPYILLLAGLGVVVLLTAWLPMVLQTLPLSLPICCIALGAGLFSLEGIGPAPSPIENPLATQRFTEMVVIIALMGAGLKLDRPFGRRGWGVTWRLLGIAMPLTILTIAGLGMWLLDLHPAVALLLAALLAPTDPVLAADVQVGPPHSGEEDEVRFALTSEAGLNDGLAFPFVMLALALAVDPQGGSLAHWLAVDVAWKLVVGLVVGWGVGKSLGYLTFRLPNRAQLSRTGDGFVALGVTCLSYGVTEMAHGYGFLAVFVTALTLRHAERSHSYHERLHEFAEQTERLLMMLLLVMFGGALAGGLLDALTWEAVGYSLLVLFVARPAAALLGLLGCGRPWPERLAIGFFGIRGVGSFYYLAFALNAVPFARPESLWSTVGFIVALSVLVHGTTVTPAMRWLDERRGT